MNQTILHSGRGAVFTADETHEMEASIMRGDNLKVRTEQFYSCQFYI